ncbi:MAG: PilZ domain-containing protein [Burkholderiales bacterium]|jgi:type IV pilus assembly protein PilZ|uniref:PilZ domain-containing protein n=1 Tax=Limnobacter sp. TaxID=2003368 RepID=UPI0039BD83F2|nr:PilZ domain-containing protein [Burkholderiales bacterium]
MTSNLMNNPRSNKDANRPWMLSLTLVDKNTAANLYMPFIKGGGIFVESDKEYNLGDPVFVLLTVGDEAKKFPINGKVVWICGANARGDKARGIGIQFPKDDTGEGVRVAIEQMIGKMQSSMKKTATL